MSHTVPASSKKIVAASRRSNSHDSLAKLSSTSNSTSTSTTARSAVIPPVSTTINPSSYQSYLQYDADSDDEAFVKSFAVASRPPKVVRSHKKMSPADKLLKQSMPKPTEQSKGEGNSFQFDVKLLENMVLVKQ